MLSHDNKKIKIVFTCLDWRLHPQIENYFSNTEEGIDMCVTAGSIKALIDPATQKFMLDQIAISQNLHHCQSVILTMHTDCGAYGGSAAFNSADQEKSAAITQLKQAKSIVNQKFPNLAAVTYLIKLNSGANGNLGYCARKYFIKYFILPQFKIF